MSARLLNAILNILVFATPVLPLAWADQPKATRPAPPTDRG
jgi:hypothetical protein